MVKIFISHSSKDSDLVKALTIMITGAMKIDQDEITCTSIVSPVGSNMPVSEQIKKNLISSKVVLGILTKQSEVSPYVLFELGAAWVQDKVVALLDKNFKIENIPGPLRDYPALRLEEKSHLISMLELSSQKSDIKLNSPRTIDNSVDFFLNGFPYGNMLLETPPFSFDSFSVWGRLTIRTAPNQPNRIIVNGRSDSAAGLVLERELPFSNMMLVFDIEYSHKCVFDHGKLFKLEINGNPIRPMEANQVNHNDSDYVNSGDKRLHFQLPSRIKKIELVFWNMQLNDLILTANIE